MNKLSSAMFAAFADEFQKIAMGAVAGKVGGKASGYVPSLKSLVSRGKARQAARAPVPSVRDLAAKGNLRQQMKAAA